MKFTKISRNVAVLALVLVLSVSLIACAGQTSKTDDVVRSICEQMFTYPSDNNKELFDAASWKGAPAIGMDELSKGIPTRYEELLKEMYGEFFTEEAYGTFVNTRIPMEAVKLAADNQKTMEFVGLENIKRETKENHSAEYMVTVKVDDTEIQQKIHVTVEDGKLVYFNYADDTLRKALGRN